MVFAITAAVVWGVWQTETSLGGEVQAVVSVAEAAQKPIPLPVLMYQIGRAHV